MSSLTHEQFWKTQVRIVSSIFPRHMKHSRKWSTSVTFSLLEMLGVVGARLPPGQSVRQTVWGVASGHYVCYYLCYSRTGANECSQTRSVR